MQRQLDNHVSAERKGDRYKQLYVSVEFAKNGNTSYRLRDVSSGRLLSPHAQGSKITPTRFNRLLTFFVVLGDPQAENCLVVVIGHSFLGCLLFSRKNGHLISVKAFEHVDFPS